MEEKIVSRMLNYIEGVGNFLTEHESNKNEAASLIRYGKELVAELSGAEISGYRCVTMCIEDLKVIGYINTESITIREAADMAEKVGEILGGEEYFDALGTVAGNYQLTSLDTAMFRITRFVRNLRKLHGSVQEFLTWWVGFGEAHDVFIEDKDGNIIGTCLTVGDLSKQDCSDCLEHMNSMVIQGVVENCFTPEIKSMFYGVINLLKYLRGASCGGQPTGENAT